MMRMCLVCALMVVLLLSVGGEAAAQEEGVVYAVLFHTPACTYCVEVIKEDLPAMQAEFGDHLRVVTINVHHEWGAQLMAQSCQPFDIPQQTCGSVPTMIVADEVLVGAVEIGERMPEIVRARLVEGGAGLPAIPGLRETLNAAGTQIEALLAGPLGGAGVIMPLF